MQPSLLREILKVTHEPNVISFAGGLPAPSSFPVDEFSEACEKVLREGGRQVLQYGASEGDRRLRELIAQRLPWKVSADDVLITNGSQQGVDLVARVLVDEGSTVLVERPTYPGALAAFKASQPFIAEVATDSDGILLDQLRLQATTDGTDARLVYVLPNFQNPTGRTMGDVRRRQLARLCDDLALPVVEDNPYGDLWFDAAPPAPVSSFIPGRSIYLGSFSKVLAPGIRLGFAVAPKEIFPKLLQAKQSCDLHTSTLVQRVAAEMLASGFIDRHVPTVRALYKSQRDVMLSAMERHLAPLGVTWGVPAGGMFIWANAPQGLDIMNWWQRSIERRVVFLPARPFFASGNPDQAFRLSFVTSTVDEIERGMSVLADTLQQQLTLL